jgi:hypothetical protein
MSLYSLSAAAQEVIQDPTAPPQYNRAAVQVVEDTQLRVQAITTVEGRKVATINGQRYHVGDQLQPYQVEDITMNYVTVRNMNNGSKLQLGVFNQSSFRQEVQQSSGGLNK